MLRRRFIERAGRGSCPSGQELLACRPGMRGCAAFEGCSVAQLAQIDSLMCAVEVEPGRVLVREGKAADQALVLISGRARVESGGTTLGTYGPPSCIGGRELLARTTNPVTVTAETRATVLASGMLEFRALVDIPAIARLIREPPVLQPAEWPRELAYAGHRS